jgi:hypothetical protein
MAWEELRLVFLRERAARKAKMFFEEFVEWGRQGLYILSFFL